MCLRYVYGVVYSSSIYNRQVEKQPMCFRDFSWYSGKTPDKKQLKGEERFILVPGWIRHEGMAVGNSMVLEVWTWDSSCHTSEQQGLLIWLPFLSSYVQSRASACGMMPPTIREGLLPISYSGNTHTHTLSMSPGGSKFNPVDTTG